MDGMCWTLIALLAAASRALASDNTTVWESLLGECPTASFSCVSGRLSRTLEAALEADLAVTDSIAFRRNANKYRAEANRGPPAEPEFGEWVSSVEAAEAELEGRAAGQPQSLHSVGGVSDVLYNKGLHYLMTHDLELGLPDLLFGGGSLRIEPRSIDTDGGAIVKIHFQEPQPQAEGRIMFKKIKQLFRKKLMTSFMAAILIIKLVKMKLMFLLPVLVGVGTAKKILLKVLLFLFPALAHLFKLCAYYHHQHTKYHLHHHHQIAHHHHHSPPVYYPAYPEYSHPPPGAEIVHRSEGNELSSWGIEYQEDPISRVYNVPKDDLLQSTGIPLSPAGPPLAPAGPPLAPAGPPLTHFPPVAALPPSQPQVAALTGTLVAAPVQKQDGFYTPILRRLDRVFAELGFTEEPCKERLVCSMYKAPARFSPHSNLVSAEISRDPSELEKPVFSNPAVIRFYRYVEAARSGQEGKDCLALFPNCSLLTE